MKRILVIGSTVIDVIVKVPHLPERGEDINIPPPLHRLGGCAWNVFEALELLESPALLCSPVGTGVYGRMVRDFMAKRGRKPFVNVDVENGCCYCLVEPDGERSFLSCHGAEYTFSRSWITAADLANADSVYVSGIELEDNAGAEIIAFVNAHPELALFFAPGPRVTYIDKDKMNAILSRRDSRGKGPFLHLNEREARLYSGTATAGIEEAAVFLAAKTNNALVITLGKRGCYCYDPDASPRGTFIAGVPVEATDTTGAGDAHCGALIAGLRQGKPLTEAAAAANRTGAAVARAHA